MKILAYPVLAVGTALWLLMLVYVTASEALNRKIRWLLERPFAISNH